jgi:hypothetical protein
VATRFVTSQKVRVRLKSRQQASGQGEPLLLASNALSSWLVRFYMKEIIVRLPGLFEKLQSRAIVQFWSGEACNIEKNILIIP